MKTKMVTLALAAIFGLGITNAQEVKKVKKEAKKELSATKKNPVLKADTKHTEKKPLK